MKKWMLSLAVATVVVSEPTIAESITEKLCTIDREQVAAAQLQISKIDAEIARFEKVGTRKMSAFANLYHSTIVSHVKQQLAGVELIKDYTQTTMKLSDDEFKDGIGSSIRYLMYKDPSIDEAIVRANSLAFQKQFQLDKEDVEGDSTTLSTTVRLPHTDLDFHAFSQTEVFYEKGRVLARVWTSWGPKSNLHGSQFSKVTVFDVATGEPAQLSRTNGRLNKDMSEDFDMAEWKENMLYSRAEAAKRLELPDGCDSLLNPEVDGKGGEPAIIR